MGRRDAWRAPCRGYARAGANDVPARRSPGRARWRACAHNAATMPQTRTRTCAIALVGDRDESITAHRALPLALGEAGRRLGVAVDVEWVPTDEIVEAARVERFDAVWCTPGSPYRSEAGALRAIRHARERRVPFLGTCGGFQHAVLEYARDMLQWADAAHAE